MSQPGLDLTTLRAAATPRRSLENIFRRIATHRRRHGGYIAVSGGKDSLVVLDLVLRVDPTTPAVFFDSGLEFPETLAYLDQLEQHYGITIATHAAQPSLLELLASDGSWDHHGTTYGAHGASLKETLILAPSRRAHHDHGPGELWGVRAAESHQRTLLYRAALAREAAPRCICCTDHTTKRDNHGGVVPRNDGTVAFAPIWDWSTEEVWRYIARRRLPVNPVYDILQRLGADGRDLRVTTMVDAEHLERGRVSWLRRGWPHIYAQLVAVLPRLAEFV